jgi:hypothetical protein
VEHYAVLRRSTARTTTDRRSRHHPHPLLLIDPSNSLHQPLLINGVLKVDDPVGTDIHLLASDVQQLTGVVPLVLSLTKPTVSNLQLVVLL